MNGFLTQQQRKDYDDNGYLFPVEVMSKAEACQHNQKLSAIEAQHGPMHSSNANTSDLRRVGLAFNYLKTSVRQVVGEGESATLVRGRDDYGHFQSEPVCASDFAPDNVVFQLASQRKKREVYDAA